MNLRCLITASHKRTGHLIGKRKAALIVLAHLESIDVLILLIALNKRIESLKILLVHHGVRLLLLFLWHALTLRMCANCGSSRMASRLAVLLSAVYGRDDDAVFVTSFIVWCSSLSLYELLYLEGLFGILAYLIRVFPFLFGVCIWKVRLVDSASSIVCCNGANATLINISIAFIAQMKCPCVIFIGCWLSLALLTCGPMCNFHLVCASSIDPYSSFLGPCVSKIIHR